MREKKTMSRGEKKGLVEGNSMKKIADVAGAWGCQPVVGKKRLIYVGVYDGLYLMEKKWVIQLQTNGLLM